MYIKYMMSVSHDVRQVHDVCIFVPMKLFREKAAWVHKAHEKEIHSVFFLRKSLFS